MCNNECTVSKKALFLTTNWTVVGLSLPYTACDWSLLCLQVVCTMLYDKTAFSGCIALIQSRHCINKKKCYYIMLKTFHLIVCHFLQFGDEILLYHTAEQKMNQRI